MAILLLMLGLAAGVVALGLGIAMTSWLLGLLAVLAGVALVAGIFVFWIFMLVSAIRNKGISDGEKVCWVLGIVFFHIIGSLLYLLIAYRKRNHPPAAFAAV